MRKISYKTKMVCCYFLLVSIPLIFSIYPSYQVIVAPVRQNIIDSINQRMMQEVNSINTELDKLQHTAYLLSTNTTLNTFFYPGYYSDLEIIEHLNNRIFPILSWFEASSPDISSYTFFINNTYIPENQFFRHHKNYASLDWMQEMTASIYSSGYYYETCHPERNYMSQTESSSKMEFSVFYPLLSTGDYLEASIRPGTLFSKMNSTPVLESGRIVAVDGNGTLLTPSLPDLEPAVLTDCLISSSVLTSDSLSQSIQIQGVPYFLSSQKIDRLDSYIICLVPGSELSNPASGVRQRFIIYILLFTSIIILLTYLISSLLIRRINRIVDGIHKIQGGNFDVHIRTHGHDEIDQLATDINYMSYTINDLINREYKAKVLQAETELSALQAQINPHFLFNILDTFKMMAVIHDLDELAESIASLGSLMRYNISSGKQKATIETEVRVITDYINIQNLLLNNRVHLLLQISEQAKNRYIPHFILQPIIENSFVHGFRDKLDDLYIKLQISEVDGLLHIVIEDNGIGIAEEQKHAIFQTFETVKQTMETASNGRSIGLANVYLRLYLIFQDSFTFALGTSDIGGMAVSLTLPDRI